MGKFISALRRVANKSVGYDSPRYEKTASRLKEITNRDSSRYIESKGERKAAFQLYQRSMAQEQKQRAARLLGLGVKRTKKGEQISYKQRASPIMEAFSGVRTTYGKNKYYNYKKAGGGRGRPKGPSGRYVIPGIGPVGVYEFRMWLRQQTRERRAALERSQQLSPSQQQALAQLQYKQNVAMQDPERRVIPDTKGTVNLRSIHQEIDDFANEIP